MKKILFLSFAVLGILSAASCKQEIAGPDGIRTVISASLPSSKTALGDKEGTSWPNYWKAGDQISVNGIVSDALGNDADGTTSAEFAFSGAVAVPYNAAYPAAAVSDYGSGSANLCLPAVQDYTDGSYDSAAFLMVGTSTNEYSVNLSPCVSVFHLSLTGSASISKVKLTGAADAALSGTFSTDFSSITPGEVSNVVELNASSPVALPAEFFICVPAGLSGELTVEVRDSDGGVMVKHANIKEPLAAGTLYSPPVLEYAADASGSFEITAENITSSTAVICWDNPEPAYIISVYSDAACTALEDSYEVSAGNACWGGAAPRFCISGLDSETTYYVQVTSDSGSSNILPVTTAGFDIVEVSSAPAAIGDVILAEDFSELRWDCDMIGAGAGWFPTAEAQSSFSMIVPASFQAATTSNEKVLSSQSAALENSRLAHWAQGANVNIYIHPGYLKLVGSSKVTHLVTPALDNIPDGQLATVEVELTASAYYSASSASFSTLDAIVAVQAPGEFAELKDNGKNTLDLERNTAPIALKEATEWNTYKVTLSGVAKGARLAFGAEKSVTGNNARMNISDIKVTIKALEEDLSLILIDSEAKFQQFVSAVASGNKTLDARVTVSGSALNLSSSTVNAFESIEDYAGTFDGNGKTISGLTKPMFATLKGTVSNLTLNSNINATDAGDVNWGIFAKVLMSDGAVASLDNCTASGSITFAPASALSSDSQIGGLVGNNKGGSIASCVNNANVTLASNGETNASQASVAGIVGRTQKSDAGQGSIVNCANNGTVACNAALSENAYIGGVVGYQVEKKEFINGCVNNGLVKAGSTFSTSKALHLGGVIGLGKGLIESCTNLSQGTVTSEEGSSTGTYLCQGGVVGRMNRDAADIPYTGLSNEGTVNVAAVGGSEYRLIGGVVGRCDEGAVITEFTNSGNINYSAESPEQVFIGGIVASNTVDGITLDNCHSTGGTLSCTGAVAQGNYYVGGIVGYSKTAITNCTNAMTVELGGEFERTNNNFNAVGGIVGSMSQNAPISDCLNTGNVIYSQQISGSYGYSYLGGVAGRAMGDVIDSSNGGTVSFTGKNDAQNFYVGGLVGDSANDEAVTISGKYSSAPATNYGSVVINTTAQSKKYVYVGGVAGRLRCGLESTSNGGPVNVISLTSTDLFVGGLVGTNSRAISGNDNLADGDINISGYTCKEYLYAGGISGLGAAAVSGDNGGDVVVSSGCAAAKTIFVGGVVGRGQGPISSSSNSGLISNGCPVAGKDSYIQVGGIVGYNNENAPVSDCHNSGEVVNTADCTSGYLYVGGVTSESDADITGSSNSGAVSNGGASGNGRPVCVGGLAGVIGGVNVSSCFNTGAVSNTGTGTNTEAGVSIAGLVGRIGGTATLTGTDSEYNYNAGPVSDTSESLRVAIGGIAGCNKGGGTDMAYAKNLPEGVLTYSGNTRYNSYIGGILGLGDAEVTMDYASNAADIAIRSITVSHQVWIGGVIGGFNASNDAVKSAHMEFTGLSNSGAIDCPNDTNGANMAAESDKVTAYSYIGGISGVGDCGSKEFLSCTNSGRIGVYNQLKVRLGGIVGYTTSNPDGCVNTGPINYCRWNPQKNGGNGCVGGIIGYTGISTLSNLTNDATVRSTGSSPNCYTGGIVGQVGSECNAFNNCNVGTSTGSQKSISGAGEDAFGSTAAGLFCSVSAARAWDFTGCKIKNGTKCQKIEVTEANLNDAVIGRNHPSNITNPPIFVESF